MNRNAFFLGFFIILAASLVYLLVPRKKDLASYQRLTEKKIFQKDNYLAETTLPYQKKTVVSKNIWVPGEEIKHIILKSPYSEVFLSSNKRKVDFSEKLSSAQCLIDDHIETFRFFTAKEAIFSFVSHGLVFQELSMGFFDKKNLMEFDEIDFSKSFFLGTSKEAFLLLQEKNPTLKASTFHAKWKICEKKP